MNMNSSNPSDSSKKNNVSDSAPAVPSTRKVGKVTGVHGLKGELYVYVFSKDVSWIDDLKEIVLEDVKGVRKIFPVESLRPFKEGFLVFVKGITDRTAAEGLRGLLVYVDADLFTTDEGDESFYLVEIENFKVFDKEIPLGVIEAFSSNTVQDLLVVRMENGVVEIPLVEDFLVDIDFDKKEVHMDLPAGLIEVQRDPKA
jgi:16S rRNA processing protein RimM